MYNSIYKAVLTEIRKPQGVESWLASILIILAVFVISILPEYRLLYLWLLLVANLLWTYVGVRWQKNSLIFLNGGNLLLVIIGFFHP